MLRNWLAIGAHALGDGESSRTSAHATITASLALGGCAGGGGSGPRRPRSALKLGYAQAGRGLLIRLTGAGQNEQLLRLLGFTLRVYPRVALGAAHMTIRRRASHQANPVGLGTATPVSDHPGRWSGRPALCELRSGQTGTALLIADRSVVG